MPRPVGVSRRRPRRRFTVGPGPKTHVLLGGGRGYAQDDVPFDLEAALREEGALYEATDPWQSKLVVDGRLITGQNPQSGTVVGEALVQALKKI